MRLKEIKKQIDVLRSEMNAVDYTNTEAILDYLMDVSDVVSELACDVTVIEQRLTRVECCLGNTLCH